jgi:glutathione S-transferase
MKKNNLSILYGSIPSPYVRRIRILLEELGHDFEFKTLNIYEPQGHEKLKSINPILQIPVYETTEGVVWDSKNIYEFLAQKNNLLTLSLENKNRLSAIEAFLDSAITLLLLKRSGFKAEEPYMFFARQRERIKTIYDWLQPWMQQEGQQRWDIVSMTLYAALDWMLYRDLALQVIQTPETQKFLDHYKNLDSVKKTDPRHELHS